MDNNDSSNLPELVKQYVAAGSLKKSINLMPGNDKDEIAIIKGIGSQIHLKDLWYRLNGYDYNYQLGKYEKKTDAIMNEEGIRNLMMILTMALRMDFSHIDEKDTPKLTMKFFKDNYPHFSVFADDFGLSSKNKNIVLTACWLPFFIAARNAKGAGHRNTVRGVFSEETLAKLAAPKKEGFFDKFLGRKGNK